MMNYEQALIVMDHALRKGADSVALWKMCSSLAGRDGVVTLRRALENADARSESPGETLTRDLVKRLRIESPDLQVEVPTREGTYRIDLAWREKKVALEFDGKVKYFDYAPTDEVLYRERQRENALIEQGWTVIRIKWRDLYQEQAFKTRLLRALNRPK
jgi:very-short-patch-repair endonuclease